jgi:diaminopimelate decarboxylase
MMTQEQLIETAQNFGTPVYIYEQEKIESQYKKLTDAFQQTPTRFFMLARLYPISIF